MHTKLISVDLYSSFGFLKKPDINDEICLTYNCLHKPALLGILGSIIGLGGFYQAYSIDKNSLPEYYLKLNNVKVGIQPLNANNGNFQKTVIIYNNSVGYANKESGGNLIIKEQTLIKPGFRVYLLLDMKKDEENKLYSYLLKGETEFIPYLGKNDFQLDWKNFKEYDLKVDSPVNNYQILTMFIKKAGTTIRDNINGINEVIFDFTEPISSDFSIYFERLPVGYDERIKNYKMGNFVFSSRKLNKEYQLDSIYCLDQDKIQYAQLF